MFKTHYKVMAGAIAALLCLSLSAMPNANADLTYSLYADGPDTGYSLIVGTITVSNNATHILITYQITGTDWNITEVHADAHKYLSDMPHTGSGNPKVGKFYCNEEFDLGDERTTYLCAIPFTHVFPPLTPYTGDVYITSQAVVQVDETALANPDYSKYVEEGVAIPESAWAGEGPDLHPFNGGRSWAMYCDYTIGG